MVLLEWKHSVKHFDTISFKQYNLWNNCNFWYLLWAMRTIATQQISVKITSNMSKQIKRQNKKVVFVVWQCDTLDSNDFLIYKMKNEEKIIQFVIVTHTHSIQYKQCQLQMEQKRISKLIMSQRNLIVFVCIFFLL